MDCRKCKADKPETEFTPVAQRYAKRGRHHWCRSCRNEYGRAYRKAYTTKYPERVAAYKRRHQVKTYGLDAAGHARLLAGQGGVCAICLSEPSRDLDVDHCHATGAVRGLLCNRCNRVLGQVGDSISILEAMASYLQKHGAK